MPSYTAQDINIHDEDFGRPSLSCQFNQRKSDMTLDNEKEIEEERKVRLGKRKMKLILISVGIILIACVATSIGVLHGAKASTTNAPSDNSNPSNQNNVTPSLSIETQNFTEDHVSSNVTKFLNDILGSFLNASTSHGSIDSLSDNTTNSTNGIFLISNTPATTKSSNTTHRATTTSTRISNKTSARKRTSASTSTPSSTPTSTPSSTPTSTSTSTSKKDSRVDSSSIQSTEKCGFPLNYEDLNMYYVHPSKSVDTGGWAMPGRCLPNRHCVYECQPGYVRTSSGYSNDECIPGQPNCKGVYEYTKSLHGLYCDSNGVLQIPSKVCERVPSYITIKNSLPYAVTSCPTVYPGSEDIRNVPYVVPASGSLELTLFPGDYWKGVGRHFYVGNMGGDPTDVCQWSSLDRGTTAYIWGGHISKDNMQAVNFDFSERFIESGGSPNYYLEVNRCSNGVCKKKCEVKRRVVGGRVENYSALYNNNGVLTSESTSASSKCYGWEPISVTYVVNLLPY